MKNLRRLCITLFLLSACGAPTNNGVCLDGVVQSALSEECDDGNGVDGDGCSLACAVETGFTCTGEPSVCTFLCGDGLILGGEQCDDGNTTAGDGCSATCQEEAGFFCSGEPSVCIPPCDTQPPTPPNTADCDACIANVEGSGAGDCAEAGGCAPFASACSLITGQGSEPQCEAIFACFNSCDAALAQCNTGCADQACLNVCQESNSTCGNDCFTANPNGANALVQTVQCDICSNCSNACDGASIGCQ